MIEKLKPTDNLETIINKINEIIDYEIGDMVTIQYSEKDNILLTTLSLKSNNYIYWYDYKIIDDKIGSLEITRLNISINGITYENIDFISINGNTEAHGVHDGYVKISKEESNV